MSRCGSTTGRWSRLDPGGAVIPEANVCGMIGILICRCADQSENYIHGSEFKLV